MKLILLLLLALILTVNSNSKSSDGEKISWDSDDHDDASDDSQSYNGLVIGVIQEDGKPVITMGSDLDDHESTYCVTFEEIYEVTGTTGDYTEVEGSTVEFDDVNWDYAQPSDTNFVVTGSFQDGDTALLTLTFNYAQDEDGNDGLEYTLQLDGYTWVSTDATASLVFGLSLDDCTEDHSYSGESGSESAADSDDVDTDATDSPDEDMDTTAAVVRRLGDDDSVDTDGDSDGDSGESDDGISSDDSDEVDVGESLFELTNPTASDVCDDGSSTDITVELEYEDDEVKVVFSHFECSLLQDPFVSVQNELMKQ
jgi:hypothetical protein